MNSVHLANTDFEFELERKRPVPLVESLRQHPILLQLQFLPFLMEGEGDVVYVTDDPGESYWDKFNWAPPPFRLFDQKEPSQVPLEVWGASEAVAEWAAERPIPYKVPPRDVVAAIHNKLFSFKHSSQLPGSALIENEQQLFDWLGTSGARRVLKTGFGVSARGHLLVDPNRPPKRLLTFCKSEWEKGRPLIGEPWVKRLADFSTQWEVSGEEIHCIGTTMLENDDHGGYLGTVVGQLSSLVSEHLDAHMAEARRILEQVVEAGYFGPVGIDAMVYEGEHGPTLHPIVELNARKTMALAAIRMQERHFPGQPLTMRYTRREEGASGLLPETLGDVHFQRQLYVVPMV